LTEKPKIVDYIWHSEWRTWKKLESFEIFCYWRNNFKGRAVFRQYTSKKHKRFRINIFKICDTAGYTVDMKVYTGRDRTCADKDVTATHATVRDLCRMIEGVRHRLYMDNFFSSLRARNQR
jgi:hypothetical protein